MPPTTGTATTTRSTFRDTCSVTAHIVAPPETVWGLLVDTAGFPSWNSTVTSIEGTVALGQKLAIRVPISKRTFNVKVTALDAPRTLTWADGRAPMFRGTRDYVLTPTDTGTEFTMTERFEGLMLPMIRRSLPDFAPVFTQYAADLKHEAERLTAARAR